MDNFILALLVFVLIAVLVFLILDSSAASLAVQQGFRGNRADSVALRQQLVNGFKVKVCLLLFLQSCP